ncbi:Ni/Fe-hydrogenase, b-type cytochrome subunit [Desulfitobacterium sp.]|uniref:Ni/Fe-hydrogenase, b-type cytochrome subunit n=1 Tax=Desulfitobacterium sp. TaxID=49981 RepID=UPI002C6E0005|nr:Ni/Fe-hydrogenase, b-type cytochrome subunit [Desulfitobacterium sp.]HVJ47805.1 Ni/Fe-hydrogenase, b-type cytochrome subunit [Desulfitobacterium sp.]
MANPLDHPLFDRLSHFINLINFLVLITTGLLIHSPFPGVPMNLVRNLHFIFMYLLIINGIVRFYYAILGKYKDYDTFLLTKQDIETFWPQIKYYLFMGKHPRTGKYNPLQKLAYLALPLLTVFQAITGLILYRPEKLGSLATSIGGLAAVRGIHYVVMWLFIAIIAVHVYLVFTEAYEMFLLMFLGKTQQKKEM